MEAGLAKVLVRFTLRLVLVAAFAIASRQGFLRAFGALVLLSATYCLLTGVMRREPVFGQLLTHWDEAAAFALIAGLLAALAPVNSL